MRLARTTVVALLAAGAFAASPGAQAERLRITAAASVRLRANPSDQSRIVATLPMGTDLVEQTTPTRPLSETLDAESRAWVRVKASDGREGWVLTGLTRALSASQRLETIEDIIRRRLVRKEDDFAVRVELLDFVEREQTHAADAEAAGRLALYRLRAIQRIAEAAGFGYEPASEPVRAWLTARRTLVAYNEPGGVWMLRHDVVTAEHDRHRATGAADDLAWLAVTNGVPGECEGEVPCYVTVTDLLAGEYLRRHPNGKHVDTAVTRIMTSARVIRPLVEQPKYFKPESHCGPLQKPLASLRAAVVATSATQRDRALEELDELGWRCQREAMSR